MGLCPILLTTDLVITHMNHFYQLLRGWRCKKNLFDFLNVKKACGYTCVFSWVHVKVYIIVILEYLWRCIRGVKYPHFIYPLCIGDTYQGLPIWSEFGFLDTGWVLSKIFHSVHGTLESKTLYMGWILLIPIHSDFIIDTYWLPSSQLDANLVNIHLKQGIFFVTLWDIQSCDHPLVTSKKNE